MDKQKFISEKMRVLVGEEKYSRPQAYAIALSYWNKREKAQQGYQSKYFSTMKQDPNNYDDDVYYMDMSLADEQLKNNNPYQSTISGMDTDKNKSKKSPKNSQEVNQKNNRINIPNLYGGVDLEGALSFAGRGFSEKNPWKAIGYTTTGLGLAAIKGARSFLSGYASGKGDSRAMDEYYNNVFKPKNSYTYVGQQGGELKNSEMLTGQFITDQAMPNMNVEGGEFIKKAQTGEVKEVVGEPHLRNGKVADGVDVRLDDGDKVLSTYMKIPAKDIKELKERYDISIKRGDTFAEALKKFDRKIKKTTETKELSKLLEKVEKQERDIKDPATKGLNIEALQAEIQKSKGKLEVLNDLSSEVFEDLFSRQERLPKKGKPGELFDKNGKLVEETRNTDYAQQGLVNQLTQPGNSASRLMGEIKEITPSAKGYRVLYDTPEGIKSDTISTDTFKGFNQTPEMRRYKLKRGEIKDDTILNSPEQVELLRKGWQNSGYNPNLVNYPESIEAYKLATGITNTTPVVTRQQGGYMQIAHKYGISPERAEELLAMQQGGIQSEQEEQMEGQMSNAQEEQGEISPEQIVMAYAEASGQDPQELMAQLQQMQPEQQQQALMQMAEQLQGGGQQEVAQQGKYSTIEGKNEYRGIAEGKQSAVEGQAYGKVTIEKALQNLYDNFPDLVEKELKDNITVDKQGNVKFKGNVKLSTQQEQIGKLQDSMNKRMKASADVILKNPDLFTEEAVKEAKRYVDEETFLDKTPGAEDPKNSIRGFDKMLGEFTSGRYALGLNILTPEDLKKAKDAGIKTFKQLKASPLYKQLDVKSKERVDKVSELAGSTDADFLITEFTPEKPATDLSVADKKINVQNNVRNVIPMLPQDLRMFPSAMQPLAKEEYRGTRLEPIKQTVEPYLAEQERMRQADVARYEMSGMSPESQEAMLATSLASSQLAANDARARVENANMQSQYQTDMYNAQARDREQIMNSQYNQDYQNKALASMANTERDWNRFYTQGNLQNRADFRTIEEYNALNATSDQYALVPGQGIVFLNNQAADIGEANITDKQYRDATPEELERLKQMKINANKKNVYFS